MIMPMGQEQLLLPVKPRFIVFSLFVATLLHIMLILPGPKVAVWVPDVLLITLLYWVVVQPRYVGLGVAFLLGLCVDIFYHSLLGQHALVYVTMAALALFMHRRLTQFNALEQTPQIALVFVLGQVLLVLVGLLSSHYWPGWWVALKPVLEALLWPVVAWVLQAPQRRPPDPDLHRPL